MNRIALFACAKQSWESNHIFELVPHSVLIRTGKWFKSAWNTSYNLIYLINVWTTTTVLWLIYILILYAVNPAYPWCLSTCSCCQMRNPLRSLELGARGMQSVRVVLDVLNTKRSELTVWYAVWEGASSISEAGGALDRYCGVLREKRTSIFRIKPGANKSTGLSPTIIAKAHLSELE